MDARNLQAQVLLANAIADLNLGGTISEIRKAIEFDPNSSGTCLNLGALLVKAQFLLAEKKIDGAIGRVKKAVPVDPHDPAAQYLLARTRRCCSWPREPTAWPVQVVTAADRSSRRDPRW